MDRNEYDKFMKKNSERLDEIKREMAYKPRAEWYAKLSFEQWIDYKNGNLSLYDPLNNTEIRQSRFWRYYFDVGSEIMLDVELMDDDEKEKYKDVIGVRGVVRECYSDMHAFAHGSSYNHEIDFDNGIKTKKWEYNKPNNFRVPTDLIIAYDESKV